MKKLKWLWKSLEGWPPLCGVQQELRERLGDEYVIAEPFLKRTGRHSETYPCPSPGGEGCPRRVVTTTPGQLQAVCGCAPKECETLDLTADDLIIYEFDWMKFCRFLATKFQLSGAPSQLGDRPGLWDLGFDQAGDSRRPVFLFTHRDSAGLQATIDHLLITFGRGAWTAVTSRRRLVSASLDELLARRECILLGLEDVLRIDEDGQLCLLEASLRPSRIGNSTEAPPENVFRREGKVWTLIFAGKTAHISHVAGMEYIAELLRRPRTPIEAAALGVTTLNNPDHPIRTDDARITAAGPPMPGIEMADAKSIKAVKAELGKMQSELASASDHSAPSKVELERKILLARQWLSQVQGRSGKVRVLPGVAQRSRSRVKHAIDRAILKIAAQHPPLGRHLKNSIQTGTTLIYLPDDVPDWRF